MFSMSMGDLVKAHQAEAVRGASRGRSASKGWAYKLPVLHARGRALQTSATIPASELPGLDISEFASFLKATAAHRDPSPLHATDDSGYEECDAAAS